MTDNAMTVRPNRSDDDAPIDAHLWVCSGKNVGRRYRIGEHPQTLGRAAGCNIVVEDERASQRHAEVRVVGRSHVIRDSQSTNGTFVNNQRISEATLRDGDLIQVGETIFEYLSFEERTVSTTSRGTFLESESIPENLRSGAQQMLRRIRKDQVTFEGPGAPQPGPSVGGPPGGAPVPPAGQGPVPGAPPVPQSGMVPPGQVYPHPYPSPDNPYGMHPYGGYPPPPPYGGHYAGYYDDEEDDEDEEKKSKEGGGVDIIGLILRVKTIVGLYIPYWPIAGALAFIGVMLGAVHFKMNPPGRTAVFQVLLQQEGTAADIISTNFGGATALKYFDEQLVERFKSPPIIEQALERLRGDKPTHDDVAEVTEQLDFFKIGQFRSNMYGGTMEAAATGDFAIRYLNTHLDLFLEREVELILGRVRADVGFFGKEVERAARNLDAAETALSDYKAKHPEAIPRQAESMYSHLFSLQQRRSTLRTNAAALEASIRENRRLLSKESRLETNSLTRRTNPYNAQIATVNGRIAAAKASGKGDNHPELVALRKQLADLQQLAQDRELNQPTAQLGLNSNYAALKTQIQGDQAKLRAVRESQKEVERDLSEQQEKIKELPQAEAQFQELARKYATATQEYELLLKKLKNAELQLERERARSDAQVQLVVAPRIDPKPVGSARMMTIAIGGIGGLMFAFLLATGHLLKNGRLPLSLILGREIDLSRLLGAQEPAHPALPAGGAGGSPDGLKAPSSDLPPLPPPAATDQDATTAVRVPSPERPQSSAEVTDVLSHRKP